MEKKYSGPVTFTTGSFSLDDKNGTEGFQTHSVVAQIGEPIHDKTYVWVSGTRKGSDFLVGQVMMTVDGVEQRFTLASPVKLAVDGGGRVRLTGGKDTPEGRNDALLEAAVLKSLDSIVLKANRRTVTGVKLTGAGQDYTRAGDKHVPVSKDGTTSPLRVELTRGPSMTDGDELPAHGPKAIEQHGYVVLQGKPSDDGRIFVATSLVLRDSTAPKLIMDRRPLAKPITIPLDEEGGFAIDKITEEQRRRITDAVKQQINDTPPPGRTKTVAFDDSPRIEVPTGIPNSGGKIFRG